tara:strand:+ start:1052 stop:1297 length:246 start_codon:yes stop_codon:yes gene_type:complete
MFKSLLPLSPVPSFWANEYNVDFDFIQDPNGAVILIKVRYNDTEEEITFSIDNDQELQQGADLLCGEGYAERLLGRLSGKN